MYIPRAFAETDHSKLHAWIEQHSFATLISNGRDELLASHLPLLLDPHAGPHGHLIGHMARANRHWEEADGQRTLAIFNGPHAYISPTWYQEKNVVPTWNYVAVHVTGTFRLDDDRVRRWEIVRRYVDFYEAAMEPPWSLDHADTDFIDNLVDGIVGFRIEIEGIAGKFKLSQNHDAQRRDRVVRALREAGNEDQQRIAKLMEEH